MTIDIFISPGWCKGCNAFWVQIHDITRLCRKCHQKELAATNCMLAEKQKAESEVTV